MAARPPRRAAAKERGGRRRKWFLVPVIGIPALLGVTLLVANPSLPGAPELERVSLELPRTAPAARPLEELMRAERRVYGTLPPALETACGAAFKEGRWPDGLEELTTALGELRPPLDEVRATLLAPGCLPEDKTTSGPMQVSHRPLMHGVRLLTLRSLIQARQGQPDQAAREIVALVDRLLVLEQECAPSLVTAMILAGSLQQLARGLGFALAHPALGRGAETEIWRCLVRLEQRPTPLPGALRWEARWLPKLLERPVDFTTVAQESRGERGANAPWPLFDKQATLALHDRLARRNVWLAGQPLDGAAWARPSPEDEYLERLRRQPRSLSWLRWNSVGTTLLAVARPTMAKYSLKWHRDRCLLAAQRARWLRDLRQRGRAPALEVPPPLDPFRQQPFTGLDRAPVCGVPRSFLAADDKLRVGSEPRPLPRLPLDAGPAGLAD